MHLSNLLMLNVDFNWFMLLGIMQLKQILALKSLLSEASGRESNFIRERNDLQQKVCHFCTSHPMNY